MFVRWLGFLIWRTEMPVSNQRNLNFWFLLKSMQLNHKVGKDRNQTLIVRLDLTVIRYNYKDGYTKGQEKTKEY